MLPEPVIAGIAAGEVAERPASVVKELVENALDAEAARVTVEYDDEQGGRIVVTDDGHGIAGGELELAVRPHATSKIRALDDLDRVGSFGFRGEALASIGAVSKLELVTRTRDVDAGSRIRVEDGAVVDLSATGARTGTRVTVSDLFGSVPARRKFLKSPSAEYALAAENLRRIALANPSVHLRLLRNRRVAFDFGPVEDLGGRLRQVYGRELASSMVEIDARHSGLSLRGAVSPAGVSFGSAKRLSLYVNGRWVHDRALFRAVMEAYRTYLLKNRYPAAVLFLEVPSDRVDVNVHPAKAEVRFDDPDLVQRFVVESVRDTLRGRASALGRWGLTEDDMDRLSRGDGDRGGPRARSTEGALRTAPTAGGYPAAPAAPGGHAGQNAKGVRADERDRSELSRRSVEHSGDVVEEADAPAGYRASTVSEPTGAQPEQQEPLGFEARGGVRLPEVVGQIFAGYIVCQSGDEMVLVDQHAAHERLIYERLVDAYHSGTTESQPLLIPLTVTVGGDGVEAVERSAGLLLRLGWELEPFGDDAVVARAVPAIATDADPAPLVENMVADLVRIAPDQAAARAAERLLATVACHSAVRVGQPLDLVAARALIAEVGAADFSACCPHGRPVARTMDRGQVERLFGR